jgi:glycosyltransferase involved in cell wall biosynthesis
VRVVRNAVNLGSTRNFEQAISLCQGEFVALCDLDDIWFPGKLATLSSILTANPDAGGVFSDGRLLDPNGQITERMLWQSVRFDAKDQQLFAGANSQKSCCAATSLPA